MAKKWKLKFNGIKTFPIGGEAAPVWKTEICRRAGIYARRSVSKNHVIASQCAHWRGNPYPLQGGALRVPSARRRPLGVVSLYEPQRERIATPACGLVRDDIYILGFFYSMGRAYMPAAM